MCGILFSTVTNLDEKIFQRALDRMVYRGPDAVGILQQNNLQLGHRRLAILDLDVRSNQPFISSDGQYAIIFNGEIYNYQEIAKRYHFTLRTQADTEVLLALYQLRGKAMLDELNGMFAFVIINKVTGEWFAARDRLGVKPLYQAQYRDGILLSSEPASLLEIMGSQQFDPIGLRQYRKLRIFFNGHTIWNGIKQFPAGYYLTEHGKLTRWWQLPSGEQIPPTDDELQALVTDAVRIREKADVSVGSYLSGGLDSTIVAGLAVHSDTWTVGFADHNEFVWGQMAATALGSRHHEIVVEYNDFLPTATQMIHQRHEPLSVPNEVLLYQMTCEAARYNKVILSGEGADELCFGYDRIFRWAASHTWDLIEFSNLYAYGSGDDLDIIEDAVSPFLHRGNTLAIVESFFQLAHLQGLLRRLDSATMLCSVEARTPFVDYRLVERLAGVPFAWRMAEGEVKAPLKRIFSGLIPAEIISRPKVGFPVPLANVAFNSIAGTTDMDKWFEFNLSTLAGVPLSLEEIV
jgi:asparagine synthase (glutamine-hydrolysing)